MLPAKAGAEVTFLEKQPRVGGRTAQGEQRADAVMVNADFANATTKLVPNSLRRRWTNEKVAKKDFSCSPFMLYLGVEGRFDHLAHHNIYVARDYSRNLDEIERQHVLSDDPSFYVENPVRTDATMAPPDTALCMCCCQSRISIRTWIGTGKKLVIVV